MSQQMNRRQWVGAMGAAGLAATATGRKATAVLGANERVTVGVMGVNSRGHGLARGFAGLEGVRVAYVCDVDHRAAEKTLKTLSDHQDFEARGVGDFRRVLDDANVDALVIATPDHWHAPATILACAAGKHVYVEKPCSHNPHEGELMVHAARKHNRVVQLGTQRRSSEGLTEAIKRLHDGAIGRVYYARCEYANRRGSIGRGSTTSPPSWLDYELWQGPAPRRAFRDNIVHYKWHWFWHWGTGELGNNGVHSIDVCRWGLDVSYPIRVASGGGRYHFEDDQETPDTQSVTFDFPERKSITWTGLSCNRHRYGGGITFQGTKGSLVLGRGGYVFLDGADQEVARVDGRGSGSAHYENFVQCVRTGRRPNADIEDGHRSTLLCHLGNIAQRTGSTLHCKPTNGHIVDNAEAKALWQREYASSWEPVV